MIQRLRDALYDIREDIRRLTGILFWCTIGSLSTMYAVAPEARLTQQLLPLELGLLIGMALVYLSHDIRREPHPRILSYEQEELL